MKYGVHVTDEFYHILRASPIMSCIEYLLILEKEKKIKKDK